ncbi:MAG: porin [Burkholderiales bacterium]|nr:porin [Burkholderiales bacterium]
MKKNLLAIAILGAFSAFVLAEESHITLYGIIDESVDVEHTKDSAATVSLASGNWYGSRWGIRGFEDLGNGNIVGFQLEQGFNANNGTVTSTGGFSRVSRLYVKGDWGEVGFGRWGSLSSGTGPYDMLYTWLGDGATSFGPTNEWDSIAGTTDRVNNSIVYVSPDFAGFKFSLMYSNGVSDDTNQWSKNQHYYGIGLNYESGGFKTTLIFDVRDQKGLPQDGYVDATFNGRYYNFNLPGIPVGVSGDLHDLEIENNIRKPIYSISFGIGYDFQYLKPQFGYTWTQQTDVASQHTFGLSTGIPIAGGDFNIGVRYMFGRFDGAMKRLANFALPHDKWGLFTLNLYYSYPISKRTYWYGYAGYTTGNKLYHFTGLVSSLFNGNTINTNGYAFQLGLRHDF